MVFRENLLSKGKKIKDSITKTSSHRFLLLPLSLVSSIDNQSYYSSVYRLTHQITCFLKDLLYLYEKPSKLFQILNYHTHKVLIIKATVLNILTLQLLISRLRHNLMCQKNMRLPSFY